MSKRIPQAVLLLALVCAAAHAQHGGGGGGSHGGGGGMGPGGPGQMMRGGGPGGLDRGDFGRRAEGPNPGFSPAGSLQRGPQLGPPGRWWDDKHFTKSISLRTEQQRRMDDIFNANKAQLVTAYVNYQHAEQRLATLPASDLNDETKVFAEIDRVAQARAELEKQNAHLLLQIRHELDGDQLARLDKELAGR